MRSPLSWHSTETDYSVEQRLVERLATLRRRRHLAEVRLKRSEGLMQMMTPAVIKQEMEDQLAASWKGSPVVLAILFAQPGSPAVRQLCERGSYFNERTGDDWHLFFPGYFTFETPEVTVNTERLFQGAYHVDEIDDSRWFFSPSYFEKFRRDIERESEGRWAYSGETDLVILSVYLPSRGISTPDWESMLAGKLTDPDVGTQSLTLAQAIEKRMKDHDYDLQDAHFGLADVFGQPTSEGEGRSGLRASIPAIIQILRALAYLLRDHG